MTTNFDANAFSPIVAELLAEPRLPELGPGKPNRAVYGRLKKLSCEELFAHPIVNHNAAAACLSGLWLWHDFLEESHSLSQSLETVAGSYWHAIMHRREPDYSNAKYWFRRVGTHPIYVELAAACNELIVAVPADSKTTFAGLRSSWAPYDFVDLCAAIARGNSAAEIPARKLAQREWELLFSTCWKEAIA